MYIVESNSPSCKDDTRGPEGNKVCLHERPQTVYYLYSMDNSNEKWINTPPGLHKLTNKTLGYQDITPEDVVRSSIWHREGGFQEKTTAANWLELQKQNINPLKTKLTEHWSSNSTMQRRQEDAYIDVTVPAKSHNQSPGNVVSSKTIINNTIVPEPANDRTYKTPSIMKDAGKALENHGRVPGGFTIPICTNPFGEAISAINTHKSRKAPCDCRPYAWKDKGDKGDITLMKKFLEDTKIGTLKKFDDICGGDLDCKGDKSQEKWGKILVFPEGISIAENLKDKKPYGRCTDHEVEEHKGPGHQKEDIEAACVKKTGKNPEHPDYDTDDPLDELENSDCE